MTADIIAKRCSGRRHWFAYYGWVGSSAPTCRRGCGTPNPHYRPEDDPFFKKEESVKKHEHTWPSELDPDTLCEGGCGTAYGDFTEPERPPVNFLEG